MRRARSVTPTLLASLLIASAAPHLVTASSSVPLDDPTAAVASAALPAAGAATPEDAVRAYLDGVAAADLDAVLAASAIDEMSSGYRFDLQTERIRAFMPFTSQAPTDHPLFVEVNKLENSSRIARQLQMLTYSLLTGEQLDGSPILDVDAAWADDFARRVDPARLAGLELEEVRFPDASLEHDDRWLENAALQARILGADEMTERLALASFEGGLFAVGFTLVRYGDGWKVSSQGSVLGRTDPLGTARPTTTEEYDRQTSGALQP